MPKFTNGSFIVSMIIFLLTSVATHGNEESSGTSHVSDPAYWKAYESTFEKGRMKHCENLNSAPVDDSSCPVGEKGWYSCMFGEKECVAKNDRLPGLGDLTGGRLGLIHPETRCDCDDGIWTCYDWNICVADVTTKATALSTKAPTVRTKAPALRTKATAVPTKAPSASLEIVKNRPAKIKHQPCGGLNDALCPSGQVCIDPDPTDKCNPGVDCPGVCALSIFKGDSDTPDIKNNSLCPSTKPQSRDMCSTGIPSGFGPEAHCNYGEICCCGSCGAKTSCLCNKGVFHCLTFWDTCPSVCPTIV